MSSIRTIALVALIGLSLGGFSLKSAAMSPQAIESAAADAASTEVTYPQVHATPDGETHFREVKVPLSKAGAPPIQLFANSELQPATTTQHAVFPAGWGVYDRDHAVFHNPSSARFITVRRGVGWIKTSDGETRRFKAGDVVEVLDVAPSKGHIFWVGEEPMTLLFSNHR